MAVRSGRVHQVQRLGLLCLHVEMDVIFHRDECGLDQDQIFLVLLLVLEYLESFTEI